MEDPEQYRLQMQWIHNLSNASMAEVCLNELRPEWSETDSQSDAESDVTDTFDECIRPIIKGIVREIEPLLHVTDNFYNHFENVRRQKQLTSTDNLPLLFSQLGVCIHSALFSDWSRNDYQALYDFLVERITSNDSRHDDRTDAFSLERFDAIHPILIHRLQSCNLKVHLTSFYDYVMFHKSQGNGVVRNPYTNMILSDADINELAQQYNRVASIFKLAIIIS